MAILKSGIIYYRKFLMVSNVDHITGATGKTVTVTLSKGPNAPGTLNTGGTAAVLELDSGNLPGVYQVTLSGVDQNVLGDLWFHCTASGCDPTDFCDQVQTNVLDDVSISSSGRVSVVSNIQQNAPLNNFPFPMTAVATNALLPGLTVTAQRLIAGLFAPCTNPVVEVGSGFYQINFSMSDTDAASILYLFTAPGANPTIIQIDTVP